MGVRADRRCRPGIARSVRSILASIVSFTLLPIVDGLRPRVRLTS
jgi:hypothetical protein